MFSAGRRHCQRTRCVGCPRQSGRSPSAGVLGIDDHDDGSGTAWSPPHEGNPTTRGSLKSPPPTPRSLGDGSHQRRLDTRVPRRETGVVDGVVAGRTGGRAEQAAAGRENGLHFRVRDRRRQRGLWIARAGSSERGVATIAGRSLGCRRQRHAPGPRACRTDRHSARARGDKTRIPCAREQEGL